MHIILIIILPFFNNVYCLSGVIWKTKLNKFVPIFDISPFNILQKEVLKASYDKEKHNFNGESIRLLFYIDSGIITTYDNNTRIKGFFGDIWTLLSEYANFTLALKIVPEKRTGIRLMDNSSYNGLLRYIEHQDADVIARIQVFSYWSDVVDFLLPLWKDRYRLFIQLSYKEKVEWIVHLFEPKFWLLMGFLHTLFLMASAIKTKYDAKLKGIKPIKNEYAEYTFYYFGVFIQRSYFLLNYQKAHKIINLAACFFSLILISFYNSKILLIMLNKSLNKPFDSLYTLDRKTDYEVLSEKDSLVHLAYEFLQIYQEKDADNELRYVIKSKRLKFLPTRKRMYQVACKTEKNYALLESERLKEKIVKYGCTFVPIGKAYFLTWVAAATRKNFIYKRTIDLGILKLFESGILNASKRRLMGLNELKDDRIFEPIDLAKVILYVVLFFSAILLSITLLIIEKIIYRIKSVY